MKRLYMRKYLYHVEDLVVVVLDVVVVVLVVLVVKLVLVVLVVNLETKKKKIVIA